MLNPHLFAWLNQHVPRRNHMFCVVKRLNQHLLHSYMNPNVSWWQMIMFAWLNQHFFALLSQHVSRWNNHFCMVKATFLMVESTCFVVKSPFLHRQTHLFCGNPGPTFARRSLGSGMVDRDCRLASPGDMDPGLERVAVFCDVFFAKKGRV